MSTFPLLSNVAVCISLVASMPPVAVNVPVAGSNSSALARASVSPSPPATSTFPVGSKVAVCKSLATVMLPVAVNVPATGAYSAALAEYAERRAKEQWGTAFILSRDLQR
jgi:hypothetical protein